VEFNKDKCYFKNCKKIFSTNFLRDYSRTKLELYDLRQKSQEIYGEYFYLIEKLADEIDDILQVINPSVVNSEKLLFNLNTEINVLKEENNRMTNLINTQDINFLNTFEKNNQTILNLTTKMVNYKNIVEKYEEKNIEMNTISEEIIKLKFEAKQEATLIITTRLKELIENQDEPKNNIAQEYNLYLKVTGFTELEKKIERYYNVK